MRESLVLARTAILSVPHSNHEYSRLLRACADRDTIRLLERRAQDARSSGELPSFPMKERTRARAPTIPHRPYLATVRRLATRKRGQPSVGLPPPSHTRPSGI